MTNKTLRVGFLTSLLFKNKTLLAPTNLETTQEYYLLENLAATLIRHSSVADNELSPCLAESWKAEKNLAEFNLINDLKWSDGSEISCQEIKNHFEQIRNNEFRHLQAFKKIKKITCENNSKLIFEFEQNVPNSFFHELTLADTALTKPLTDQNSWRVTSGAYFVSGINEEKKEVLLNKNKYFFSNTSINYPENVLLRPIPIHLENPLDCNTNESVDYIAPQGWSFSPIVKKIQKNAPTFIEGKASLIHYISFLHASKEVRNNLKFAVEQTNKIKELIPINSEPHNQMIPVGFNGFIKSIANHSKAVALKNEKLTLFIHPLYECINPWLDQLKLELSKVGIQVNIVFGDITNITQKNGENVALLHIFKGNMKDPAGSWSFLSDPKHGPMRGYHEIILPLLKKATEATTEENKSKFLNELHQMVLDQNIIIPLWSEKTFMFYNQNVARIEANPFDFRIHFFEIEMK